MIYIIVIIVLIIGAVFFEQQSCNKVYKRIWWYFELSLIVLLWGLRYKVGGDTQSYFIKYEDIPTLGELLSGYNYGESEYQPLWLFFNSITKMLGPEFYIFQLFHALIVNSVIFWFIKRNSNRPFLVVLVYFIIISPYFCTEILRESLAVCCFLIGLSSLLSKRWGKYYVCAFVALGFHASAICLLFFPVMLTFLNRYKPRTIVLIILCSVLLLSLSTFFSSFMFHIVRQLGNISIENRLETYSALEFNINGLIFSAITIIIYLFFLIIYGKKLDSKELAIVYLYIFIACIVVQLPFFGRLLNYIIMPFLVVVINHITYNNISLKFSHRFAINVLLFFILMNKLSYYFTDVSEFNYGNEAYNYHKYYPYNSIFNEEEDLRRANIYWNGFNYN